jgi:hypothetical protein
MKYLLLLLAFVSSLTMAQTSNATFTPFASNALTSTTVNSPDIQNDKYRGAHVIVNVSTFTSGTYTPKIQGKDPVTGTYYDILVGPAIAATGTTILKIYPGIGTVVNGAASDVLPQTWRVVLTGASTPNMVLSVVANMEI